MNLSLTQCYELTMVYAMLQLQGKTDQRFVECAFKVFRDVFGIKPVVNPAQFLEQVSVCSHSGC